MELDDDDDAVGSALLAPQPQVAYSYVTCGNLDTYSENSYTKELEGQTLRVSFPGDSSSGYTLKTDPITGQKIGSVVAFMDAVAERGNFQYEIRNVSQASKDRYTSSSYTACVVRIRAVCHDFIQALQHP